MLISFENQVQFTVYQNNCKRYEIYNNEKIICSIENNFCNSHNKIYTLRNSDLVPFHLNYIFVCCFYNSHFGNSQLDNL